MTDVQGIVLTLSVLGGLAVGSMLVRPSWPVAAVAVAVVVALAAVGVTVAM